MEMSMEKSRPIITLITDFGLRDPYVGTMKGVMLKINPELSFVDLTHEIESHNILEAAMILGSAYRYFPKDTIHLVVVDPGVGSDRRPILALTDKYYFVSPDNGVLSFVYKDPGLKKVLELGAKRYFLDEVGDTFHGRDIFSPVASWLSKGVDVSSFGDEIHNYVQIPIPESELENNRIKGRIVYVDKFGNLVSNIKMSLFRKALSASSKKKFKITLGTLEINEINKYYIEKEKGTASALFNSWGNLEIYVPMKSASKIYGIKKGKKITIDFI
ncbi:MAG TPA: SAM-dependent chlorinase/fluorinase [Nitrospinota bacterium]|nr:SAM-dependent chlorinase/fluorinase [Nitrospinota bacterium]